MSGKDAVESICNDLGINQKKLAEIMKISSNTVSSWKNEKLGLPSWAEVMFELLRERKECNEYKNVIFKLKLSN